METWIYLLIDSPWIGFLPYLWGMETIQPWYRSTSISLFLPYLWGMETFGTGLLILPKTSVLTVPMRNGNYSGSSILNNSSRFLPYLWGMETTPFHRKCQYLFTVLTVPMRNGNAMRLRLQYSTVCVLTVPMRNGNFLASTAWRGDLMSSYRTYEEWKQRYSYILKRNTRVLTVPMRNGNYH